MLSALKAGLRIASTMRHATILVYHGVLKRQLSYPVWQYLDADAFERQVAWLSRHCNCVTLGDLVENIKDSNWRRRTIAVTFDDGLLTTSSVALPILQHYGVPATVFVTTGYIGSNRRIWPESLAGILDVTTRGEVAVWGQTHGVSGIAAKQETYRAMVHRLKDLSWDEQKEHLDVLAAAAGVDRSRWDDDPVLGQLRMMSWDEVRQMKETGLIEIGAHSVTHARLSTLPQAAALHEIVESKRAIEAVTGPVRYFAYPYGGEKDYLPSHKDLVAEAGFEAAFSSDADCVTTLANRYSIPRWGIGSQTTMEELQYAVCGGLATMNGHFRFRKKSPAASAIGE